jgi:hypothetical protein
LDVEKPMFWKYVSQNKDVKTSFMNCPMDYLYQLTLDFKYADHRQTVDLNEFLIKRNIKDGDRKQEGKIIDYVEQMCRKINFIHASVKDENERNHVLQDVIKYYEYYIVKLKVNPETMYGIVLKVVKNNKSNISSKLMNILYKTQKEIFLDAFCQ